MKTKMILKDVIALANHVSVIDPSLDDEALMRDIFNVSGNVVRMCFRSENDTSLHGINIEVDTSKEIEINESGEALIDNLNLGLPGAESNFWVTFKHRTDKPVTQLYLREQFITDALSMMPELKQHHKDHLRTRFNELFGEKK